MSEPQLKVGIEVSANTAGATQAKTAVQGVADANKQLGKATEQAAVGTKNLGQNLQQAAQAGGAAAAVFNGIEGAAQGGAQGVLGMVGAVRGFITLVRGAIAGSGPIGLLIAALGILGGLALGLVDKFKPATKSIEDLKKETDAAAASAKSLADAKLTALKSTLETVTKAAGAARDEFALLQAAKDRLENAKLAANLEELKIKPGITEEQRTKEEARLRREADREKRRGEVQKLEKEASIAGDEAAGKGEIFRKANAESQAATAKVAALDQRDDAAKVKQQEFLALQDRVLTTDYRDPFKKQEAMRDLEKQRAAAIDFIKKNQVSAPERAGAETELAGAKQREEAARSVFDESKQRADAARRRANLEKDTQAKEQPFLDRAEKARLSGEVTQARKTDTAAALPEKERRAKLAEEKRSLIDRLGAGTATDADRARFTEVQREEGQRGGAAAVKKAAEEIKPVDLSPVTQAQQQANAVTQQNVLQLTTAFGEVVKFQGDVSAQIAELRRGLEAQARAVANAKSTQ